MFETKSWSRYYEGDDLETGASHYDTVVRNGFIRKVFGILSIQLSITVLIALPMVLVESVKQYCFQNPWLAYLSMGLTLVFVILISCVPGVATNYPTNYVVLFAFTICEGFLVGFVSATYSPMIVLAAAMITVGITVSLTIFAFQTKWDFTMLRGILLSVLLGLLFTGIFLIFFKNRIATVIYCGVGAVLFSVYLVYDVQLIAGGRKHEFGVDDYIPAALAVYLDIINLFLFILRLLGNSRN